jgi:CRISPR-associated protein Csm3
MSPFEHQVRIEATMTLASALHIGVAGADRQLASRDLATLTNPLDGLPYVPGSSLKGRLRSLLRQHPPVLAESVFAPRSPEQQLGVLFGHAAGVRGRLSLWDAHALPDQGGAARLLHRRGEMPARGAFVSREVVSAGTRLRFRATLDSREQDLLDWVLAGLKLLEWEGLGAGTSRGMGRVRFSGLCCNGHPVQDRFDAIVLGEGP